MDTPVLPLALKPRVDGRDARVAVLCVGLVLAIGLVDYATGIDVSVVLLYLLPVGLGAWLSGRITGIVMALASAAAWLAADLLERGVPASLWVPAWNALMLAGIFTVVAWALAAQQRTTAGLEATVARRTATLEQEVARRRVAQAQLLQAHGELQRTQLQLIDAAKMQAVGRMAAGVAHEVKNPLMTLGLGADYFLQRQPASEEEAALLCDMKLAVARASSIINGLLDFARPRPLTLAPEDLNAVVEDALKLVRHPLREGKVCVVRELQPGLPLLALDRIRIEHVIVNLVTNALQAMQSMRDPSPGRTLTVRTALRCDPGRRTGPARHVALEIDDTGPGIPAAQLPNVFEPFFTTKPPGQGTGLGLAIVHRIVQIHGGRIELGNLPGGGARATLTFNPTPEDPP